MGNQSRALEDDWNAHWHHYADSATQNPAQLMRHSLIAQLLAEDCGVERMRVFDFGSGQGDLLHRLDALFPEAELAAAELSESGVAISRRKVPRARVLAADIFNPPPTLEEFSGWATHGVCSEVLEHVDDPVAFLSCARKYMAENARLIVTVPGGPVSSFDKHIGHRQYFDRQKIGAILEQAGYRLERTYLAGFPFFNLYRLVVIARGKRLALDVESQAGGTFTRAAGVAMKVFRALFRANFRDSPFGWQVVATARKSAS
jgi:SAM-dependent methyltransferase